MPPLRHTIPRHQSYLAGKLAMARPYSPAANLLARIVPPSSQNEVSSCVNVLAAAFDKVPCTNSFSIESGQTVREYVAKTVHASLLSGGGALVEAGDTSAVALWELPYTEDKFTFSSNYVRATGAEGAHAAPIKKEWKDVVGRAKERYLGVERSLSQIRVSPHYHLDFLARNPHMPKVAGAVSAVVAPFLSRAKEDQLSVWLEATSLDVVPLYEHFGFKVVEEITVGAGRVDRDGQVQVGGEGVKAWLMLVEN